MAHVEVRQLRSKNDGKAYLNVNEAEGYVSVLTHIYTCPIYMCWRGSMFYLFIFDGQEWADEYFEENGEAFTKIQKIEPYNGE